MLAYKSLMPLLQHFFHASANHVNFQDIPKLRGLFMPIIKSTNKLRAHRTGSKSIRELCDVRKHIKLSRAPVEFGLMFAPGTLRYAAPRYRDGRKTKHDWHWTLSPREDSA